LLYIEIAYNLRSCVDSATYIRDLVLLKKITGTKKSRLSAILKELQNIKWLQCNLLKVKDCCQYSKKIQNFKYIVICKIALRVAEFLI
jgi:hypothetical protein